MLAALVDYVIFVSVDGLRSDAIQAAASDTYTDPDPNTTADLTGFHNLMRHGGAFTLNARNDYDITETMQNHVSQMAARPVWTGNNAGHHWSTNNYDPDTQASTTIHTNWTNHYVPSVFDEAHDRGAVTGLYVGKEKLEIFDTSYDAVDPTGQNSDYQMGRVDTIGVDNTRDKIDYMPTTTIETNDNAMITRFGSDMRATPMNFSLLHFRHPDSAGHSSNWIDTNGNLTSGYLTAVYNVDSYLDTLLTMVGESQFAGRTAIVLTADHGGGRGTDGSRNNHGDASYWGNYTIPFIVWSPWSLSGGNLYDMNINSAASTQTRWDPSTNRIANNSSNQPIHHGDGTNLALQLLGMPAIDQSYWNTAQDLNFGTLQIEGSDAVDTIGVTLSASTLSVTKNGSTSTYDSADYARILINTYGGNDSITFGTNVTQHAWVDAGAGNDTIRTGAGNDTVYAGDGADFIWTNNGSDVVYGGLDHDNAYGGFGNDSLYGEGGWDTLYGGDISGIDSGDGNDYLEGGDDNDSYRWPGLSQGDDTVVESDSASGVDELYFYYFGKPITVNLGLTGWQTVNATDTTRINLSDNDSFEQLVGTGGDDRLIGNTRNNILAGSLGDDTYVFIGAVTGDDTIYEPVNGGTGDCLDFSQFTAGPVSLDLRLTTRQQLGTDQANGLTIPYEATVEIENVIASPSPLNMVVGNDYPNVLTAMSSGTTLLGGAGNDTLIGTSLADSMEGGAGNDSLVGNDGNDTMRGGAGDDTLVGGYGDDMEYGDAGNDWLFGDVGNDGIYGGDGNDYVYGGYGNDYLEGGAGNDYLWGQDGLDVLHTLDYAYGNDWMDGGAGYGDSILAMDYGDYYINVP